MSKRGKVVYNGIKTRVNDSNRVFEMSSTTPPIVEEGRVRIYNEYLTLNGDGTTFDMKVDGSVTPQEFYIQALPDRDIYISTVTFLVLAELTITDLSEFAGLNTALTNGCDFFYVDEQVGEIQLTRTITTNFDFVRATQAALSIGIAANDMFKIGNVTSNSDEGFFCLFKFKNYGYESEYRGGLKLRGGTNERLVFRINDDLALTPSSISELDVKAFGYTRLL
jgi:hypothetical protein